ncbi:MAG: ComEC/Rec2 family competence protein [Sarcina sp.]
MEKLEFKNPIIDIFLAIVMGMFLFVYFYIKQEGVLFISIPILVFLFLIYNKKIYIIFFLAMILGFSSMNSYYKFSINKSDSFTARVEKKYEDYYLVNSNGRKMKLYSEESLDKYEKINFDGKFKSEINIDRGEVGHLFVKENLKRKKDLLFKLRGLSDKYYMSLEEKIGADKASIITALVFGNKDYIDKNELDSMKNIGVLHLICISGFHIVFIYNLLKRISNSGIALSLVFIYVILTGLTGSGLRAYIMLIILEGANLVRKNYKSIVALVVSAMLLLIFRPYYLSDAGFYLSYFATLGILLFNRTFNKVFYFLPKFLNKSISMSFSAQVFIYPIMIFLFSGFSINFILGSLLLTPIIYFLVPIGILSVVLFCININMTILDNIMSIFTEVFCIIIKYLKFYAFDFYQTEIIYAVVYLIILGVLCAIYKGYLSKRYIVLAGFLVVSIFISLINVFPKLYIYKKNFNSAIIYEHGINKIAFTSSESDFFLKRLKSECRVNSIINNEEDLNIRLNNSGKIIIKDKIEESFIMLRDNNYGIIDLLNDDESIVFIGNKIYINERGI